MLNILGTAASLAGSILPGIFGGDSKKDALRASQRANRSARRQQKAAIREQRRVDKLNRQYAADAAARDYARAQEAATTAYNRQRELARDSVKLIAQGAREAGIHPLAALGTQYGSVGPAATVQEYAPSGQSGYQPYSPSIPDLGGVSQTGNIIGDGLLSVGNALLNQERTALENELLRSQIQQTRMATVATSRSMMQNGLSLGALGGAMYDATVDPQARTAYGISGFKVLPAPGTNDVQVIADRLGEPAEWAFAPLIGALDYSYNYERLHNWVERQLPPRDKFGTRQFFKP